MLFADECVSNIIIRHYVKRFISVSLQSPIEAENKDYIQRLNLVQRIQVVTNENGNFIHYLKPMNTGPQMVVTYHVLFTVIN